MVRGSGDTQLDRLRLERDAARKVWEDKGRPGWQAAQERTRKAQEALDRKRADRDRVLGERQATFHRVREKGSKSVAWARKRAGKAEDKASSWPHHQSDSCESQIVRKKRDQTAEALDEAERKREEAVAAARKKLRESRERHDELVQRATDHVERMEARERVLYDESEVQAHRWDDLDARVKDIEAELGIVG